MCILLRACDFFSQVLLANHYQLCLSLARKFFDLRAIFELQRTIFCPNINSSSSSSISRSSENVKYSSLELELCVFLPDLTLIQLSSNASSTNTSSSSSSIRLTSAHDKSADRLRQTTRQQIRRRRRERRRRRRTTTSLVQHKQRITINYLLLWVLLLVCGAFN